MFLSVFPDVSVNINANMVYVLTADNSLYSIPWARSSSPQLLYTFMSPGRTLSLDWLNHKLYVALLDQVNELKNIDIVSHFLQYFDTSVLHVRDTRLLLHCSRL